MPLANRRFESWSDGGLAILTEFLASHAKEFPDAKALLETGLEQAKEGNKRVLVQMSGPACGPCILLSEFLSGQKDLVSKDYVHVKLDLRMPNAEIVKDSLGAEFRGVPWMAILSKDGRPLANSLSPKGNIAFPRGESQKKHFRKMLETTSQRLSESEIEALLAALPPSPRQSLPK